MYMDKIFSVNVLVYPVDEVAGLGVDPSMHGPRTALAPGYDATQLIATHDWSSRVPLSNS